ncbi:ATP-dependent protease ClpP protease subunit [Agrobacterium vitis]|nr:ATP-dependent protease ClpP protease subunit [Agrobacterium vitis]
MSSLIKNGELHLYGTVGGDAIWDEDGIKTAGFTDENVIEALAELDGDISIRLNSAGGSAFQGIAIYNALREHSARITVYVDALAASAASVIAMAGDLVVMRPGSMMMIHNPASITIGTADDHRKSAMTLDQIAEAAAEIYVRKSGKPAREILRMMKDETWMSGSIARSLGFADEIEENGEEMAAPAFQYALFKNTPSELLNSGARRRGETLPSQANQSIRKEIIVKTQTSIKDATNEVFSRCRAAKLNMDDTELVIREANGNIETARDLIINMIADRSGPETISHLPNSSLNGGFRSPEVEHQISDALLMQMGGRVENPNGNPYKNLSVMENVRNFCQSRGISTQGMNDATLADSVMGIRRSSMGGLSARLEGSGMHTVSDFPALMGNALYRYVVQRFNQSPSPIKSLSLKRNLADFRKHSYVRPGESPELQKVTESGQITYGTLEEEANGLTLDTYARLFAISRQALINDDLSALSSSALIFADGARKLEDRLFYELLSANSMGGALMDDGLPLFHANHGNKADTGGAINEATVSAARQAMRLQKDVNGTGNAGVVPSVLLVGPKQETAAEKFVATISAATTSEANPFSGKLRVEVENQYEGLGWWLFADAQQRPVIQHGYLNGVEGPDLQQSEGWKTLGMEFRCVLDFGCAPFDYRGGYFNPGVAP